MKSNFLVYIFLTFLNSHAQSPVIPIFDEGYQEDVVNAYYKDSFNDFDNFTGTWLYTNGNTSLKITFQKSLMYHDEYGQNYRDILFGEYQYIEGGVEKLNTLSLLMTPQMDVILHSIVGSAIIGNENVPVCNDCPPGQKRVVMSFEDPERNNVPGLYGRLIVMRADIGNTQKIKISLEPKGNILITDDAEPLYTSFNVPWGEYILTKVP